jgi:twitching motility protein PilT
MEAYTHGIITEESATTYCTKRSVVSRGIDNAKKERGEATNSGASLRMKPGAAAGGPPLLKMK